MISDHQTGIIVNKQVALKHLRPRVIEISTVTQVAFKTTINDRRCAVVLDEETDLEILGKATVGNLTGSLTTHFDTDFVSRKSQPLQVWRAALDKNSCCSAFDYTVCYSCGAIHPFETQTFPVFT